MILQPLCIYPLSRIARPSATLALVILLSTITAAAQTLSILHSFDDATGDAEAPIASVVSDASGNLFGTGNAGGMYHNNGAVFEVLPAGATWTESVILNFDGSGGSRTGGFFPVAGLILDSAGNLYGTTPNGGSYVGSFCGGPEGDGCGIVFELSPNGDGTWSEKALHLFNYNGKDGVIPWSGLVFDAAGNLYGTPMGTFPLAAWSPILRGTSTGTRKNPVRMLRELSLNYPRARLEHLGSKDSA